MLSIGYREAIRTLRKRKRLTQEICAERAGMQPKLWSKYETGKVRITANALERMRRAIGCSEVELFHLALPYQHLYHEGHGQEVREPTYEYGKTPTVGGPVRRLRNLDVQELPAEDQHWLKAERDHLVVLLEHGLTLADNLIEKYLYLMAQARRAQDAEDDLNRSDT